jgi:MFS transporter, DHA1 family, multidrug resistance protein
VACRACAEAQHTAGESDAAQEITSRQIVDSSVAARHSRFIFLLALIIGAQPIATDLYLPAMPDLAQNLPNLVLLRMDFSSASTLTFFTLFYGLGQVMAGYCVDRFGRRPSLLVALAGYTACAVGCIFATSMAFLLVLRSLQGIATAAIVVTARAAMRDSYSVQDAPRVMSQVYTRLGIVVVLCPIVGAVLATHGGWRGALAAIALYGALLLVMCAWQFGETQPSRPDTSLSIPSGWPLLKTLWASPSFRHWTLVTSMTMSGIFTFLTVSSHLLIGLMGLSAYAYGLALVGGALTFICSNVLCTRLLKKHPIERIAKLGAVLSLAGGAVQLLAAYAGESNAVHPVSLVAIVLIGQYLYVLGHGLLQPCAMAASTADFPHMAGSASAWSGLVMMVVAFVVSQTTASFVNTAHTNGLWPMALAVFSCGLALVVLARQLTPARR